jgi:hypothetical protein
MKPEGTDKITFFQKTIMEEKSKMTVTTRGIVYLSMKLDKV